MIICAKTVNVEIANTDCVKTRNYAKEVKVKRYGDRGGHGAAEGACGAGSGSSLSALRPGMVSVSARVTKVRCVRCPEDSVSRKLSNTALVCGSERRNTVRGPVTQEETRRLLTRNVAGPASQRQMHEGGGLALLSLLGSGSCCARQRTVVGGGATLVKEQSTRVRELLLRDPP